MVHPAAWSPSVRCTKRRRRASPFILMDTSTVTDAHGDVVDLCAAVDGVPIGEAVKKLAGAPWVISTSALPAERPKPEPYRLSDEGPETVSGKCVVVSHRFRSFLSRFQKHVLGRKRNENNVQRVLRQNNLFLFLNGVRITCRPASIYRLFALWVTSPTARR